MAWLETGDISKMKPVKVKSYPRSALSHFGRNVAELRRKAGLTQEGLAEKIDINIRHLQKIEAGEVSPSFGSILRLRAAFQTTWSELFSGCDPAAR